MAFRALGFLAAGVVLGFVLGGLAPQAKLSEIEAERDALAQRLERVERPNPLRQLIPAFGERISPPREREASGEEATAAGARPDEAPDDRDRASASSGVDVVRATDEGRRGAVARRPSTAEVGEGAPLPAAPNTTESETTRRGRGFERLTLSRFDELATAQALRAAASRAALIEQAGLSKEEVVAVDRTVDKMNNQLAGYGEEILAQVSAEEPPTASQALGLGHDTTGIMYEAQKELETILGERTESVEPEAMQVWNHVDVKRLRPAAEKLLPQVEDDNVAAAPAAAGDEEPAE
jgi:hypothetical protein